MNMYIQFQSKVWTIAIFMFLKLIYYAQACIYLTEYTEQNSHIQQDILQTYIVIKD